MGHTVLLLVGKTWNGLCRDRESSGSVRDILGVEESRPKVSLNMQPFTFQRRITSDVILHHPFFFFFLFPPRDHTDEEPGRWHESVRQARVLSQQA